MLGVEALLAPGTVGADITHWGQQVYWALKRRGLKRKRAFPEHHIYNLKHAALSLRG